jgi:hypothetical protein
MGVMQALRVAVSGGTSVEVAQAAVTQAEAALATEARRIEQAEADITRSSDEIAAVDPDADDKRFARLIQARDGARGRLEALHVRRSRAETALADALEALKAAETADKRAELARIDSEIHERDQALTREMHEVSARVQAEQAALRDLAARAQAITGELRREAGSTTKMWRTNSQWIVAGGSPLDVAAAVVGR